MQYRATPMGHAYWGLQACYVVITPTPISYAHWGLQACAPCVYTARALHVHGMHTACARYTHGTLTACTLQTTLPCSCCTCTCMPLQLLHVMNATLLWTRHNNIDFSLGRRWGDVDCFALRPRCAMRARCTAADLLRRPWQPQGLEQRDGASEWPPPATYAGPRGAHPMRSSCSDNWFQCAGSHSRMCQEADAAAAPLDRAAPRALFVACAERACEERSRLKAGGARCAGGRAVLTLVHLKPQPQPKPSPTTQPQPQPQPSL